MKYYKLLNKENEIIMLGEGNCVPSNAIEITEEEYRQYVPENAIIDEEYQNDMM